MAIKNPRNKISGWIALDKPYGMGSTQALAKVRWLFNAEKAGHGGTLDPLATGLLPIALGEATKTVQWAMDGQKTYQFRVQWGSETTTDDLEGTTISTSVSRPSQNDIESILSQFIGEVDQTPPAFSAIKIDGERAYDLARAGAAPEMQPRLVTIESLKLRDGSNPEYADFELVCGKGTYVRSLARDLGRALGCLGHVSALRRTQVGALHENQMISLAMLEELSHKPADQGALQKALHSIETVLDGIPALAVLEKDAARLRQGQKVLLRGANAPISEAAVLIRCENQPIGIGEISQGFLKTKRLFNL